MATDFSPVPTVETVAPKLPDTVLDMIKVPLTPMIGHGVSVYFNGPTDQLSGLCAGVAILEPGKSPHPPHQHPEEELLIIGTGTGEIECDGKMYPVSAGSMMYCAGNIWHSVTNTGSEPMTFYWSKWMAKSAQ